MLPQSLPGTAAALKAGTGGAVQEQFRLFWKCEFYAQWYPLLVALVATPHFCLP